MIAIVPVLPSPMRKPVRGEMLRERLDALVATFDISTITPDPLQLVLRYDDPRDQEVAGLLAAAFAYGRADIVVANVGSVLDRMGPSPFAYISAFNRARAMRDFKGFAHRFHKTPELVALLQLLAVAIRKYGSLGKLFRECYSNDDADIGPSLQRFVDVLLCGTDTPVCAGTDKSVRATPALRYLLTSPKDGSACKRMNLFLRWMVRRTSPDLGLWTFVDPAKLVMPVDTHIHRIATFLGINRRKSADWKAARDITDRLARFDRA